MNLFKRMVILLGLVLTLTVPVPGSGPGADDYKCK